MSTLAILDFDMTLFKTFPEWVEGFPEKYLPLQYEKFHKEMDQNLKDESLVSYIQESCAMHLFPESIDLINLLHQKYDRVILMTYGVPEFQEAKVKASGIETYFDEIMYVQSDKAEIIKDKFVHNFEAITFINDNTTENALMKELNPNVRVIEIDNVSPDGYALKKFYESL